MVLFNWIKQEKSPAEHPYYGAYVKVDGDLIRSNNDHDQKREMRLEEVGRISVVSYVDENQPEDYWIYFWPFSGSDSLSVTFKAVEEFQGLTKAMKSIPGFNIERYEHAASGAGKKHTLVYEKEATPFTAQLFPAKDSTAFEKIASCIWLEGQQKLIPWGSFAELEQLNIFRKSKVFAPISDYYYYQYLLEDVSIFGGLKLKKRTTATQVEENDRKLNDQLPVTLFYAGIILGFANAAYCRIFEWKDVQKFILITEYWRDELSSDQLWYRETKTRRQQRLLSFSPPIHFSMDAFLSGLTELTGLKCIQREDRQYY